MQRPGIDRCIETFSADLLFLTGLVLEYFPEWMRPVVAPFIPSRRRLKRCVEKSKEIVSDQLEILNSCKANGIEPEDTLMGWMLESGTPEECKLG